MASKKSARAFKSYSNYIDWPECRQEFRHAERRWFQESLHCVVESRKRGKMDTRRLAELSLFFMSGVSDPGGVPGVITLPSAYHKWLEESRPSNDDWESAYNALKEFCEKFEVPIQPRRVLASRLKYCLAQGAERDLVSEDLIDDRLKARRLSFVRLISGDPEMMESGVPDFLKGWAKLDPWPPPEGVDQFEHGSTLGEKKIESGNNLSSLDIRENERTPPNLFIKKGIIAFFVTLFVFVGMSHQLMQETTSRYSYLGGEAPKSPRIQAELKRLFALVKERRFGGARGPLNRIIEMNLDASQQAAAILTIMDLQGAQRQIDKALRKLTDQQIAQLMRGQDISASGDAEIDKLLSALYRQSITNRRTLTREQNK